MENIRSMHPKALTGHVNFSFLPPPRFSLRRWRCQSGVAADGRPAHPVLALGPQLALGQLQAQFESLVLLPVEGQLHQVVVHGLLEEFGDLADRGANQAVHDGRQMRLKRGHRLLHHLKQSLGQLRV